MHKTCTKCGEEKPLSDYFIKNSETNRYHAQCKSCYKLHRQNYASTHYQKYRQAYLTRAANRRKKLRLEFRHKMLIHLKGKGCVVCGEADIRVLEFDHLDPLQKKFTISQAVKLGHTWEEVLIEISKCQLLCANCHKKKTAEQYGWYKS